MKTHGLWIDGEWQESGSKREILSPFDGRKVADCSQATATQMDAAIAASARAFESMKRTSSYARARLLGAMAQSLQRRRKDLTDLIVHEAGKPRTLADGEVGRAIQTFTIAAEEAKRRMGEVMPVDLDPAG